LYIYIAQLLLSQNAFFDFNNLKDSCTSIRPDNSSKLYIEVLNEILSSKEIQGIKEVSDRSYELICSFCRF